MSPHLLLISSPAAARVAGAGALIEAVAWDGRAQRLAVALGSAHPDAGSVALYDTRCDPIVSARFIGFMRLGPLQAPAAAAAGVGGDWEEIQPEEVAEAAGATGSAAGGVAAAVRRSGGSGGSAGAAAGTAAAAGDGGSLPAELAFMPGFAQGALLAARKGDHIAAVPMFFAA
jgi:hypothetical protein